jgi:hypothetical protein
MSHYYLQINSGPKEVGVHSASKSKNQNNCAESAVLKERDILQLPSATGQTSCRSVYAYTSRL